MPLRLSDINIRTLLLELGWKAELGLEDMCADSWRWISSNPNGFGDAAVS